MIESQMNNEKIDESIFPLVKFYRVPKDETPEYLLEKWNEIMGYDETSTFEYIMKPQDGTNYKWFWPHKRIRNRINSEFHYCNFSFKEGMYITDAGMQYPFFENDKEFDAIFEKVDHNLARYRKQRSNEQILRECEKIKEYVQEELWDEISKEEFSKIYDRILMPGYSVNSHFIKDDLCCMKLKDFDVMFVVNKTHNCLEGFYGDCFYSRVSGSYPWYSPDECRGHNNKTIKRLFGNLSWILRS